MSIQWSTLSQGRSKTAATESATLETSWKLILILVPWFESWVQYTQCGLGVVTDLRTPFLHFCQKEGTGYDMWGWLFHSEHCLEFFFFLWQALCQLVPWRSGRGGSLRQDGESSCLPWLGLTRTHKCHRRPADDLHCVDCQGLPEPEGRSEIPVWISRSQGKNN